MELLGLEFEGSGSSSDILSDGFEIHFVPGSPVSDLLLDVILDSLVVGGDLHSEVLDLLLEPLKVFLDPCGPL